MSQDFEIVFSEEPEEVLFEPLQPTPLEGAEASETPESLFNSE